MRTGESHTPNTANVQYTLDKQNLLWEGNKERIQAAAAMPEFNFKFTIDLLALKGWSCSTVLGKNAV